MKVAICSIVKDTPNYLMKAWIDHHFSIGVTDIYVTVDINSKPIYQDSRVHYEYLTKKTRTECINLGKKYAIDIATNDGMYFQVGVYNYMVQKYRKKYDWIALIDDDEFLRLDLNVLNKYSDKLCVYIPWRDRITYNIENTQTLDDYILFTNKEGNFPGDSFWLKSIINTKLADHIHHIHCGPCCGVLIDDDEYINPYHSSTYHILAKNYNKTINYIDHYHMRSFEEWVEKVIDRGDMLTVQYNEPYWGRDLKHYFTNINIVSQEGIEYSKENVDKLLDYIHREDVKEHPLYEWNDYPKLPQGYHKLVVLDPNINLKKYKKDTLYIKLEHNIVDHCLENIVYLNYNLFMLRAKLIPIYNQIYDMNYVGAVKYILRNKNFESISVLSIDN